MSHIKARITPNKKLLVTSYKINSNTLRMGDIFNVDANNAEDGGLLLYNGTSENWEAKNVLENPNTQINGGDY